MKPAIDYFKKAKAIYTDDDVEIDIPSETEAESLLSRNDEGAWVRAWVWIAESDLEEE